jgi:glyoxylase-like metal-dependent hydrolase (beta-lactamase superfamily II)
MLKRSSGACPAGQALAMAGLMCLVANPCLAGTPEPSAAHNDAGIPVLTADSFSAPVFRGTQPGQPQRVYHLVLSQWETNVYVLVGKTSQGIVIDPTDYLEALTGGGWGLTGRDTDRLIDLLQKEHIDVKYIVCTHGHLDHVSGTVALKKRYHCILCMSPADVDANGRPKDSHMFPGGLPRVDQMLHDGDMLKCDGIALKVLATPGHSPGSISLVCGNWVFAGDTLFYHTVGRTNFVDGSGNWDKELASIRQKLYVLPPATLVLPGHGYFTTIGEEKAHNPWTSDQLADAPH